MTVTEKEKEAARAWSERMRAVLEGCRPSFGLALAKLGDCEMIVEVAASVYEKSVGLKWAKELRHDGMLFPYNTDMIASFTMSEVFVDLDIFWFNSARELIAVTENAEALSGHITPPVPYRYVLEVPAGSVDAKIGDVLDF